MSIPTAPGYAAHVPGESGMPCPNCGSELTTRKTSRGILYDCPKCRGRAVNAAVVRRVLGNEVVRGLWSHAQIGGADQGKKCPSCRRPMTDVVTGARHGNVHMDVCRRCQLAWFDSGEFDDFQMIPPPLPPPAPGHVTGEKAALAMLEADRRSRREIPLDAGEAPDETWKWLPAAFGLPVEEDSSFERLPWLTWGLSGVLVLVYLLTASHLRDAVEQFGLIPALAWRDGGATLLTSFFIHGSLLHLVGNVYFLIVFGDNVENDIGRWRDAALLLSATLAGGLLHIALDVRPMVPCVGASGGIAGVLAYYALRFPKARIFMLIGIFSRFVYRWFQLRAVWAFGLWIVLQIGIAILQTHAAGDVSGLAHVGGASVGLTAWGLRRFVLGKPADA